MRKRRFKFRFMKFINSLHGVAVFALGTGGLLAAHSWSAGALVFWSLWLIYALHLGSSMRGNRFSSRLLIVPPLLVFLATAPNVIYNFAQFARGSPVYLDSPGTILVVLTFAFFTTIPALLLLCAYWGQRQWLFGKTASNTNTAHSLE